jgi:hypothetical protein
MKALKLIIVLMLLGQLSGFAQNSKAVSTVSTTDKVEAYYFHFSVRCKTCRTVEAETKKDLESLYPELMKQGKITFQQVNLDEDTGRVIADKLKVYTQTLLLVKKSIKINITNEGFRYAPSNPEKYKAIIKERVDGLLKM